MDLLDSNYLKELKFAYDVLKKTYDDYDLEIPKNVPLIKNGDLLKRFLDCSIIERTVELNKNITMKEYDSVRGVFFEGKELYPNAGFKDKNHIQIAIRNPNFIKGYFAPRTIDNKYPRV